MKTNLASAGWLSLALLLADLSSANQASIIQCEPFPTHMWSGETVEIVARFINRTGATGAAVMRWRFVLSAAHLVEGEKSFALTPDGGEPVTINFQAPELRHVSNVACRFLVMQGEDVLTDQRTEITIFPAWDPEPLRRLLSNADVAVADPSGLLQKTLSPHSLEYRQTPTAQALRAFRGRTIILGPGARSSPNLVASALEAAEAGLTVLWLEPGETSEWQEPFGLPESSAVGSAHVAPLSPGHPALEGLRRSDLQHWRCERYPDYMMARPRGGNFRPIAALARATPDFSLLELFPGTGRIVLCQMPVVRCFETEPVARILLESLVRYSLTEVPEFHPAILWAPPDSALPALVEEARAELIEDGLPSSSLLIIAADAHSLDYAKNREPALRDKIRAHLNAGGKCLFIGAEPAGKPFLESAGLPAVEFQLFPLLPLLPLSPEPVPLAWGISIPHLWQVLEAADPTPIIQHMVSATDSTVAIAPGAVIKLQVGSGEAILCQFALHRAPEHPAVVNLFRQLLTNLAVRLHRKDEQ
jgi:hypothetical protein